MVKCCTNQARPGTSVTALSSACLKCSDTTGSEFVISSCAPCVPRQLSDKDQNAHDAPEITFTKAGAWAWRHLRNERVRRSRPLAPQRTFWVRSIEPAAQFACVIQLMS
jgi:hypothetical protein